MVYLSAFVEHAESLSLSKKAERQGRDGLRTKRAIRHASRLKRKMPRIWLMRGIFKVI
jgi:hypothetical protein